MKKIIFISLSLILLSCSKYQKVLKSTDFSMKYDKAIEFYNKGDFNRALPLLEELSSVYRGTDKSEEILIITFASFFFISLPKYFDIKKTPDKPTDNSLFHFSREKLKARMPIKLLPYKGLLVRHKFEKGWDHLRKDMMLVMLRDGVRSNSYISIQLLSTVVG